MLVVFSITMVAILSVSSIAPALPAVARNFGISASEAGWLISAFTIPGIFLTPVMGLLGDRFGRKKVLIPALLLFGLTGSSCAFVGVFDYLLVLRFFQGVGASALGALNFALIGDLYSGEERVTAFGYNSSMISVGAAGYPLLGGLLVLVGWQYPFLLALVAFPVALVVAFCLPSMSGPSRESLGEYFRNLLRALRMFEIGVIYAANLVVFVVLYGLLLAYLPFLLERKLEAGSVAFGLVMAANAAVAAFASFNLGPLARRFSQRRVAVFAFASIAPPAALMPFAPGLWAVFVLSAILGGAIGLSLAIFQTLISDLAPEGQRGALVALSGMMIRTGQSIGPPLMGLLFAFGGMIAVFLGGAILVLLTIPVLAAALRGYRR